MSDNFSFQEPFFSSFFSRVKPRPNPLMLLRRRQSFISIYIYNLYQSENTRTFAFYWSVFGLALKSSKLCKPNSGKAGLSGKPERKWGIFRYDIQAATCPK